MRAPRLRSLLLFALLAAAAVAVRQRLTGDDRGAVPAGDPFLRATTKAPPAGSRSRSAAPTPATTSVRPKDLPASDPDGRAAGPTPLPGPPHGPFTQAPSGEADDLKRISGIGPKLEEMLNDEGITTFAQLAELTEDQVEALQARLPQFPGRIRRDDWVAQAQRLREA